MGLPAPQATPVADGVLSATLSQVNAVAGSIAGRKVAVIADAGSDLTGIATLRTALLAQGATLFVLAAIGGVLKNGRRTEIVERTFLTARSIEFDATVIADGTTPTADTKSVLLLQEAYRHCKALAAWGDGHAALTAAAIPLDGPGVSTADTLDKTFITDLVTALGLHRAWERAADVMTSTVPPAR